MSTTIPKEDGLILLWSFTVILVVMNTTMFNVALPQVTAEFGLTATSASWIVTGYSIVFAIASITYSRLSDFIPIRNLIVIGLACMGLASLVGFFSQSFLLLMAARLFQAAGAAAVPGLGIVLVARYIPLSRRGKAMSKIISAGSLGFGLGPVIGGMITEYLGWNDLFAITAFALLLIPFLYRMLPGAKTEKINFDLLGAALIGIGITGLLLFLTLHSLTAMGVGIISLAAFTYRIHRTENPFVQPALFRNRSYMLLTGMGFASYVANLSTLFLMPLMFIRMFGESTTTTGFLIFPGAILSAIVSNQVGKIIDKFGNRLLIRAGHLLLILATLLFAFFSHLSPYAVMAIYMVMGMGVTSLTASVSNEVSRILDKEQVGAGMGLLQLTQFFGGAFGVAMTGTALVWQKATPLKLAFSHVFIGITVLMAISFLGYVRYASLNTGLRGEVSGS